MKTSARNELSGKVIEIKSGAVMTEVKVEVSNGVVVCATITNEAKESLGLSVGASASALIKSSSIILASSDLKASARNIIKGEIKEVVKGQVNSEIKISVGANTLCAVVTNDSVSELGLVAGKTVSAIFKASSVILVA